MRRQLARSVRPIKYLLLLTLLLGTGLFFGCKLPWALSIPEVPTGVVASDGSFTDKVKISWHTVEEADHYLIYRASEEEGPYEKIGTANSISYDDTSVSPNVTYWYKVRACNSAGCSAYSQADSGYASNPSATIPEAPASVSATDGDYLDRVRVSWEAVPGATQYQVWRDVSEHGPYTLKATVTGTSYDDLDPVPGMVYWYKVRACNAAGCGPFSSPDSGFSYPSAPDPVTGVNATDGVYRDKVRVTWEASTGAARYDVYRSETENGTYTKQGEVTATSYNDTSVTPGTIYWYKVKACNAAGCSAFSVPDSGYASQGGGGGGGGGGGTGAPPPAPSKATASDGAFLDKIHITWPSVSGASGYRVYRSDTGQVGTFTQIAETTGTSYDDTEPGICEEKWYAVSAWNSAGESELSNPDSGYKGTTLGAVDSSKVTVTQTPSSTTADVTLSWPAVENAAEAHVIYEIWRMSPPGAYTLIKTTDDTKYTDEGLPLGETFYYKIRVCSDYDCISCGDYSGEIVVYVACSPQPPADVTVTKNDGTVTVSWNGVTGASSYEVYRATSKNGSYTFLNSTTNTSYTDTTVQTPSSGSVTYYYKVKTCIDCGCGNLSEASNGVKFTEP